MKWKPWLYRGYVCSIFLGDTMVPIIEKDYLFRAKKLWPVGPERVFLALYYYFWRRLVYLGFRILVRRRMHHPNGK